MTRLLTALSLLICVVTTEANAWTPGYRFNGKDLFDLCTSAQDNAAYFSCVLYLKGFLAGISIATSGTGEYRDTTSNMSLCLPRKLSPGLAAAAIVQEWRSIQITKPSIGIGPLAQADADEAVSLLLMLAYPCKQ